MRAIRLLFGLLALCVGTAAAAQNYPTRPIRMIVGVPPGGTTDIRLLARGVEPVGGHPHELRELVAREIAHWSKVIRVAGLKVE